MIPRLNHRHRGEHFRVKFGPQVEDQDLEVVEMDELDDEVPFDFTLPRGWVATFTKGEDDEDASLSDTFGSGGQEGPAHRSARLDFPAVMTLAAERVGLPLPPPLPQRPVMAHFHYSAELALSVPCRAVPVFGCASTRPSYGHFFTSFLARQNCGANKRG